MRIPEGSIVIALVDIHDDASNRKIPQHAKVGDLGVVEWYDDDDFPTINWGKGTGFGVYDSHKSQVAVIDAAIVAKISSENPIIEYDEDEDDDEDESDDC